MSKNADIKNTTQESPTAASPLKDAEERLHYVLQNMDDAYFETDACGNFTLVNRSFCRTLGYSRPELLGMNFRALSAVGITESIDEIYRKAAKSGNGQAAIALDVIGKDRKLRRMEFSVSHVSGSTGELSGFRGVGRETTDTLEAARDISDRKNVESEFRKQRDALLKEQRFNQLLLDASRAFIVAIDINGRVIMMNRSMLAAVEYGLEDVKGKDYLATFVPEEEHRSVDEVFSEILKEGSFTFSENRILGKSGRACLVQWHGGLIPSGSGEANFIVGIGMDITARKRSEEELKKSQAQLSAFLYFVPALVLIKDHELRPVYANQKYASLFPFEDWKGKKPEETFPPDTAAFIKEQDMDAMEKGHVRYEENWTDAGGCDHVFETEKFKITIPGADPLLGAIITDITGRKKAEEALRRSEERFRDMAELMPETVFEADLAGRLTFVNEIAFKYFGFKPEDMEKGLNVLDVMAPENHARILVNYQRIIEGEQLGLSEYLARRKDGSTFPVLIHTTCIYQDRKPSGLRGFLIDISEKKAMEEQLLRAQKMEAIGTLAGGIAHDFNNLLMGILGNLSLMLMDIEESHPFHRRIKNVEEFVQRGADLTRQLLGFARGGKFEVRPTDLTKFVRRSAELFGRTKKEISIHHQAELSLWYVHVDRGQMDQVLLNLFRNAWQAMPDGGDLYLSLENTCLCEEDVSAFDVAPGRFVKLSVRDTGIGMDEATSSRIFEPFFSTKERGHGTGLGLASVYGIIKNHGGFITVKSEKGLGTDFIIYLPAFDRAAEEEPRWEKILHRGKETILFIDDEEMIVDVGMQMLSGLGYKVLPAVGGRQGISLFEQNKDHIDLVILDIIMPDITGKETFYALTRLNPSVKVLLASGYSLESQAGEIMAKGCKGFIQKPFSTADLSAKVREVLDVD